VRDSGLVAAVAQLLYDEAALLDEWRLDETPHAYADILASFRDGGAWRERAFIACVAV